MVGRAVRLKAVHAFLRASHLKPTGHHWECCVGSEGEGEGEEDEDEREKEDGEVRLRKRLGSNRGKVIRPKLICG